MDQLREVAAYLERSANSNSVQPALPLIDIGENSVEVQRDLNVGGDVGLNELSWLGLDIETSQNTPKSNDDLLKMIEESLDAEDGASSNLNGQLFTESMPDLINFDESQAITQDLNKSVSLPSLSWLHDERFNCVNVEDLVAFFEAWNLSDIDKLLNDQASTSQIEQDLDRYQSFQ